MKFLVDMPLSPNVADWLHKKGHMSVHASQVGLHDAPDAAIMAAAVTDDRVVITADLDYPRLLAMSGANRPSLILFRGGNYSEAPFSSSEAPACGHEQLPRKSPAIMSPPECAATPHGKVLRTRGNAWTPVLKEPHPN